MLSFSLIQSSWHKINGLLRFVILSALLLCAGIALLVVLLRYWVLPNIENWHPQIETSLSQALGQTIHIGRIEGEWQGLRPRLDFYEVRLLDKAGDTALYLPKTSNVVSWLSLATLQLRLHSLVVSNPELLIRRDNAGQIYVGGIALIEQQQDSDFADWVLHQPRLQIENARLVWLDEKRGSPALELQQLNVNVRNFFSHHRFAVHAVPANQLASPVLLKGDLWGDSFQHRAGWRGQFYLQVDYTDITRWGAWLKLPTQLSQGQGGVRAWLNIDQGKPTQLRADIDLRQVKTQLGEQLPELNLQRVLGRVNWLGDDQTNQLETQGLTLQLANGQQLPAMDWFYRQSRDSQTQQPSGELRLNQLDLHSALQLTPFLPLGVSLQQDIYGLSPSGQVKDVKLKWRGEWAALQDYEIYGQFDQLAWSHYQKIPAVSGLSLTLNGNRQQGKVEIQADKLLLDAPGVLREALPPTRINSSLSWQKLENEWLFKINRLEAENADLSGLASGSFLTQTGTLGNLDLEVQLSRGNVKYAARYTPLIALHQAGSDWLAGALLSGTTNDLRIKIQGNLSHFPPGGAQPVLFELDGHAKDVRLRFAEDWPVIENIAGRVQMLNESLLVTAPSATMAGAQLRNVSVNFPDSLRHDLPMILHGTAQADGQVFLDFIQRSPVRGYINGMTDGMTAGAPAQLALQAYIPLHEVPAGVHQPGQQPLKVNGRVSLLNNRLGLGPGLPELTAINGQLLFSQTGLATQQLTASLWGQALTIQANTDAKGAIQAQLRGSTRIEALRKQQPHPLLNGLDGQAEWEAQVQLVGKDVVTVLNSDLRGVVSRLPEPFAKSAETSLPLRLEHKSLSPTQDSIQLQLGRLLSARLINEQVKNGSQLKQLALNFGQTSWRWPERDGIWIAGHLPVLPLAAWGALFNQAGESDALAIDGIELQLGRLYGYGLEQENLKIKGKRSAQKLQLQLSSRELAGDLEWQGQGGGKLTLDLRQLILNPAEEKNDQKTLAVKPALSPSELPALQVNVDKLVYKGKNLGKFELLGHPEAQDWRLRRLKIDNPDSVINATGLWQGNRQQAKTSLNVEMEVRDAGALLARFAYPDKIKKAEGKLQAQFNWAGSPEMFDFALLNGNLKLETGSGQFLKMEPGVGKLLSIFSLQALPRRITLDFSDVFSQGFQFDRIVADAQIQQGQLKLNQMVIDGSAAKVAMLGQIDLVRENQQLQVTVMPTVGNSVSLIGAFAAGPAVGLGALLLQKVLGNPLDKLVAFEYQISGSWDDPQISKKGSSTNTGAQFSR